jgi:hypothetical protein
MKRRKKLSCSDHFYSDQSKERDECNYLSEVRLFVENHQVCFRVYPPTLTEYLVEIEAKIARGTQEAMKGMTAPSAYEKCMKSHEEERRNSTRKFERFTRLNLLGTDFLDSFKYSN